MSTSSRRFGKYELQDRLGRGGMAEVWKAFDTRLRRYIAIKFLHADFQAEPDFVDRFTREAQVIAALRHPNIVQIYDFYCAEKGEGDRNPDSTESNVIAYMVMEYIQGETLADYIHDTSHRGKFPSADEVVRLFTPISLALDYAHQQGTIHRDIKPANILLDQRNTARNAMGEPILSDFGLAKLLNAASQTVAGTVFGTPLYISPEQVQNRPVSNRTDLYSLGVVLYEIFTGTPPFHGDSLTGIMLQHLTEKPIEPHLVNQQLPPELSAVILKSMAKDPQARYPTAATMTAAVAKAFKLPVPQELRSATSSIADIDMSAYETQYSNSSSGLGSPPAPARVALTDQQGAEPTSDGVAEQHFPNTVPPVGAISEPLNLPDSEAHLNAPADEAEQTVLKQSASQQSHKGTAAKSPDQEDEGVQKDKKASNLYDQLTVLPMRNEQPTIISQGSAGAVPPTPLPVSANVPGSIPMTPPPATPLPGQIASPPAAPVSYKGRGMRIALVAVLICVLVAAGLGAFFALNHGGTVATTGANTVVGHAFFASSGQVNETTNQGSNDELQITLQNISAPQAGKSYYAWLMPDKSQVEAPSILLGKLSVNHGTVNFLYPGDSQHTNLLGITSGFLITEEASNVTPQVPSPDQTTWRYSATIPQTPAPGQQYSLLDHLRHLLAKDPDLEAVGLQGGLDIWAYRNIQQVQNLAVSSRSDLDNKNFGSMHNHFISILDYLDGSSFVRQDVPAGTPIIATNPKFVQLGLLELNTQQNPPGYLYHIALHLNGVLASPGATQDQRNVATQINNGINNERTWLGQVRQDAKKLVVMNQTQLASPSALALLNDMETQANAAFAGKVDPSQGQLDGYEQIYVEVQRLATLDVKPFTK